MKFIAVDFNQHEVQVLIEALGGQAGPGDVRLAYFTGSARDKVLDPVLRFEPLVEVLVSREYHVDTVLQEHGFQYRPQLEIGAMPLAGRIQRMMEETDLPFFAGAA